MLNQLTRLSIEADGSYATEQELQFLTSYLESVDQRVISYEKIKNAEAEIIDKTKAKIDAQNPNLFIRGSKDLSSIWRRDITIVLRSSVAAMLINDLDWLRESLLLWHRTIVNANKTLDISQATYIAMSEVMEEYLSSAEVKFILPVLQLNSSILGS